MPTVELVGAPAVPQVPGVSGQKEARSDGALFGQLMEQGTANITLTPAQMLVNSLTGTMRHTDAAEGLPDAAPQDAEAGQTPDAALALMLAGMLGWNTPNAAPQTGTPQESAPTDPTAAPVAALPTLGENTQNASMPAQTAPLQDGRPPEPDMGQTQIDASGSAENAAGAAVLEKITQTVAQAAQTASGQGESGESAPQNTAPQQKERVSATDALHPPLMPFARLSEELSTAELETLEKTQAVHTALERLTEDLQHVRATPTELQLTLEPQRLGSLTISLIMTDRGLSAHIKTADREISELIGAQLQTLTEGLRDKGVTLDHVEVSYESLAQQNGQSGRGQGFHEGRQQQEQSTFDRMQNRERIATENPQPVFSGTAAGWNAQGAVEYRV